NQTIRDTTLWTDSTLIDKEYYWDNMQSGGGGGITEGQLTDSLNKVTLQRAFDNSVANEDDPTINGNDGNMTLVNFTTFAAASSFSPELANLITYLEVNKSASILA